MKSYLKVVMALLTVAVLTGYCGVGLSQNATAPTSGEERILIVMSDGASSVHKLGDQRVKIRTASGESEVPLSKIVYIYSGKAKIVLAEQGLIRGEVLDGSVPVQTDDGATKQIPVSEMRFLGIVPRDISGDVISRFEIIVAAGKVAKYVFSTPARIQSDERGEAANKQLTATAASAPRRMWVGILDEYWTDRLFTLSNASHSTVLKKEVQTSSILTVQGPPFPVEFDIVKLHPCDKGFMVGLGIRSKIKQGGWAQRVRYWSPLWSGPLVEGSKERVKTSFQCMDGLEGSGEVYLYVTEAGPNESHEKELSKVELYKTVSNVLRLPIRFE